MMSESTIHRPTYGETLLNRLLRDLPKKTNLLRLKKRKAVCVMTRE